MIVYFFQLKKMNDLNLNTEILSNLLLNKLHPLQKQNTHIKTLRKQNKTR